MNNKEMNNKEMDMMKNMLNMMALMGDKTAEALKIKMEIAKKWQTIMEKQLENKKNKSIDIDIDNIHSFEELMEMKNEDGEKLVDFFTQVNMETDLFMKENGYKYEK